MKNGDLKVTTVYLKDGKNVAFDVQNAVGTKTVDIDGIANAIQSGHSFVNATYTPSTKTFRVDSNVPRKPLKTLQVVRAICKFDTENILVDLVYSDKSHFYPIITVQQAYNAYSNGVALKNMIIDSSNNIQFTPACYNLTEKEWWEFVRETGGYSANDASIINRLNEYMRDK